jgi:glucosamine-6-phosphate deaminase
MRKNLSSQITLTRIPERYYKPDNAFEYSVLTRFEKIPTHIFATMDEGSFELAKEIAAGIKDKESKNEKYVMVLPGGRSPHSVFNHLIKLHKNGELSFNNVIVFLLYEFYPLSSATNSNLHQTKKAFLNHIDIPRENIFYPDGFMDKNTIYEFSKEYEEKIKSYGGIDIAILGIGLAGTIGLNSAGTTSASRTHFVLMDNTSRKESAQLFNSIENVPEGVITMGLGTIMDSKKIVLISWGESKSAILKKTIEGPAIDSIPSTCLQHHTNVNIYVDLSSAFDLTRISHPWLVTNCEWDNKLIRRAIVWLCTITKKPILKLTNKDYSEHGLGELLALYGSAYNVNIKIFNDIQHTITGWPGGKPNADDSNRPERAEPYPKKIIVFSPHPDDDVISMGGTLRRLCDQKHDVHVAYQVSGNIAVGDEEVIRYCEYLHDVCQAYSPDDDGRIRAKADEIINYLRFEKKEDDQPERLDVLFMKGTIRREEARHAARYSGLKDENIHFLDLPFYETGLVRKNPVSQKDVDAVKNLLLKIKPDSIFVAGDLADPHGTHKVCLDAILAAIDDVKNQEWMQQNCYVWMYRGAWAEWEMDHIEMAVPISPEELRHKRIAILKHQSQAESAPFLGDDERLFWQRAEDRNRATAEIYKQLGLASYEAIEAFVRYIPIK